MVDLALDGRSQMLCTAGVNSVAAQTCLGEDKGSSSCLTFRLGMID